MKTADELAKTVDERALEKGVLLLVHGPQGNHFVVIRG